MKKFLFILTALAVLVCTLSSCGNKKSVQDEEVTEDRFDISAAGFLDDYFDAIAESDESFLAFSIPDFYINYLEEYSSENEYSEENFQELGNAVMEGFNADYNVSEVSEIEYEIISDDEYSTEKNKELEDKAFEFYGHYSYDREEFTITNAHVIDLKLTIISSDGTKTEGEMKEFFVFKENGQWKTFSEVIV